MKNYLLGVGILLCGLLHAQRPVLEMEYRQKFGFLAAHHAVMGHLPQDQAVASEFSIFGQTKGAKAWHAPYRYPRIGVTFFHGSVGNDVVLGRFTGAYAFSEFSMNRGNRFKLSGKLGAGLGYTPKVFDQHLNPKNVAISSHVNAQICLGMKAAFLFGKNRITLGMDLTHFSNGSYQVPNLGVNIPYLSIGYGRALHEMKQVKDSVLSKITYQKWFIGATAIGSIKEVFPTGGRKYPVMALSLHARKYAKPKVGVEFALDLMYKGSIMDYRDEIEKKPIDIVQVGAYLGYLLPLDHFHYVLGMGYYLRDKYQPDEPFYHRVGMRYLFDSGLFTQVVLKSHWAKADYVEWGIGYTFNQRK